MSVEIIGNKKTLGIPGLEIVRKTTPGVSTGVYNLPSENYKQGHAANSNQL